MVDKPAEVRRAAWKSQSCLEVVSRRNCDPDTAEKRPLTGWNSRLRPGIPGDMAKTKLDGLGEYPPILGERVRSTNVLWLVRTYTELR